jgi:dipicolinate synthase subunit B
MNEVTLGFAMCGSFCTFHAVLQQLQRLRERFAHIIPIMSENSYTTDTRFGSAAEFRQAMEDICGHCVLHTIAQTEPIGPKKLLDALIVAPCTGNTLAKLANGVADTSVTLACKAHLRNERPLILAVSTNDGLGANGANLGRLLARKHVYFVPFGQDDAAAKPCSLVADFSQLGETIHAALEGRQIQPMLLT